MKSAVVISVLAALVYSAYSADLKDLAEITDKCKTETGFKGLSKEIKTEGAPKEEKCFLKCVYESKGMLKKDGTIDLDLIKSYLDMDKTAPVEIKEKILKAVEECSKEVKPDPSDMCETAYKYYSCKWQKLNPKKD